MMKEKKAESWGTWFWIILFIIIIASVVRHSYYRQAIYDDLYKDQLLQQQQENYSQQQSKEETHLITCYPKSNQKCDSELQQYKYNTSLCKGSADCFIGTVSYIFDGDTLTVNGIKVRLALTNTPESYETGFNEATQFTKTLCPVGSSALVDEDDGQTEGSYGRTIAVVYCGNYNLNEQLLELSYGRIWVEYCKVSEFKNENWAVKFGC